MKYRIAQLKNNLYEVQLQVTFLGHIGWRTEYTSRFLFLAKHYINKQIKKERRKFQKIKGLETDIIIEEFEV